MDTHGYQVSLGHIHSSLSFVRIFFYKMKHILTMQSSNHISWYLPKEAENLGSKKDLHMNVL